LQKLIEVTYNNEMNVGVISKSPLFGCMLHLYYQIPNVVWPVF